MKEAYQKLLEAFVKDLKERRKKLLSFYEKTQKRELSEEEKKALRLLAHKLAGTAGTYGFDEISQKAFVLEDLLVKGEDFSDVLRELLELIEE